MAIITTTEELKNYVEVSAGLNITTLKPSIRVAERRFLAPLLGQELYDSLQAAYTTAGNKADAITDDELLKIAPLAQEAVANLAMMEVVPRLSVQISDAGMRRSESDTQKTAYQYQQLDLQASYGKAGFDALDDLLRLLQANIELYPEFRSGDGYVAATEYLITSASEFNDYYHIASSNMTFQSIRYIMKRIEFSEALPLIGKSFFNALKSSQASGTISQNNVDLLKNYLKPAIALLTVAKALIERKVDVTDQGVTVSFKGFTNNVSQSNTAGRSDTDIMVQQLTIDGNDFLSRMGAELAANPDLYPDFAAIQSSSNSINITNRPCNGLFAV